MFRSALLTLSFALVFATACTKKDKDKAPPSTGSADTGSATGVGSAMTGSDGGSAMAGSGSGSDAGSGSAMASSGSNAGSAAGSGSGSAVADGEKTEFDKLSHEDKVKFMKTKVMPPMKAAFQKFDAKEYANFTCKTCHGKDPQKSKYKMPNPELEKLDFKAIKKGEYKEAVEFMSKVVKPQMAKILGEHDMTEAEPTGFGCLHCHVQQK